MFGLLNLEFCFSSDVFGFMTSHLVFSSPFIPEFLEIIWSEFLVSAAPPPVAQSQPFSSPACQIVCFVLLVSLLQTSQLNKMKTELDGKMNHSCLSAVLSESKILGKIILSSN